MTDHPVDSSILDAIEQGHSERGGQTPQAWLRRHAQLLTALHQKTTRIRIAGAFGLSQKQVSGIVSDACRAVLRSGAVSEAAEGVCAKRCTSCPHAAQGTGFNSPTCGLGTHECWSPFVAMGTVRDHQYRTPALRRRRAYVLERPPMPARRFAALTRVLTRTLPRRGMLRATAAVATAASASVLVPWRLHAQDAVPAENVTLPCVPCNCTGNECDCCLVGITGGGVLRTATGDVNVVLFATQLADDAPQQAAGFVRWMDPHTNGGLVLESVGPVAYETPSSDARLRNVSGTVSINGGELQPFELQVMDAGPGKATEDAASLRVGGSGSSGFVYEAAGTMIGGDLQLLSDVAAITPA